MREVHEVPSQIPVWEKKHGEGDHQLLVGQPSPLCVLAKDYLPEHANIIELGCGVGRDAEYFSTLGHTVLATDGSPVVIHQNLARYHASRVDYRVLDLAQEDWGLQAGVFDVVHANLALHYFVDAETRRIFKKVNGLLKAGGLLVFACKSSDTYRTDGATIIEPDVYVAANGHALHTFTTDYVGDLLKGDYDIEHLDEVQEEYQGRVSGIVRCIARRV